MNWYIGQEVVCIDGDHFHKQDQVYSILGLRESHCKCGGISLYVGVRADVRVYEPDLLCPDCNVMIREVDDKVWQHECCFRPLDSLADISELTEVLSDPIFKVNHF